MANVSRFAPEFWWQLVGGRVLRLRSISVQSRVLLPATCITWFLSTCVDILVPNSWFGYRCCSSCSSSLLFCLCCTSSMLSSMSWYRDYADSSAVFSSFHGMSDYHTCCKTPDYKYWMPNLIKEITVFRKMDWLSFHLWLLAKYYNRVFSAIMFTLLNSTINRTQVVISLNALCTLVFEWQFVVVRLSQLF